MAHQLLDLHQFVYFAFVQRQIDNALEQCAEGGQRAAGEAERVQAQRLQIITVLRYQFGDAALIGRPEFLRRQSQRVYLLAEAHQYGAGDVQRVRHTRYADLLVAREIK